MPTPAAPHADDRALFDRIDLHLIRMLHQVLTERSVSRAALRLGMHQPAVSAALKRLREMPSYRTTPILMLTTEAADSMKQQGRAAGATGWLVKPFDPPKLLEVTKKVLN